MKSYSPPPDKSITIRALLLAAVAEGSTRIENPLFSEDTEAAVRCLEALGVRLCRDGNAFIVEGRGLKGLKDPGSELDAGESGALARMLAGILAGQAFQSVITGSGSLLKRPMNPLAESLKKLGARVKTAKGRLPLYVKPARLKGSKITGTESAQLKSALLLAGLYAGGTVEIKEKFPTRDHTERMLTLMGARLTKKGQTLKLAAGPLSARPLTVPGDISSAAPFIAAALITGRELKIFSCGQNPARMGFLAALRKMGAFIKLKPAAAFPEPYGEIEILPSALRARSFKAAEIPAMIDEIPLLALLAAGTRGTTVIAGLAGLRTKESDRVESTLALLASLGVKAVYKKGVLRITGRPSFSASGPVDTFSDHRIAMAAAAASLACPGLKIKNPGCVDKSYPGFWRDFKEVFT
ncbi:MAG: 3-phosphoshikimate 1-carboxyvinyltransferase [Elusimicrobia bacterium CG1_02_56_21]|nr:MAG: 3-phosphoshikimate 1-carboxyvinyltransferase [Elusimicrobia bacterium CG1_02_56_21]